MKAYVLVNPNNNRLVDNKIPTYPSILPTYDIVFGPTSDTVGPVPDWYIEHHGCRDAIRKRGYCAYVGHMTAICNHYAKYPDEDLLVMEDDVVFEPNFNEYYRNFMKMVPQNCDAIYFGGWYFDNTPTEIVPNVLKPDNKGYIFGAECILLNSRLIKLIVTYYNAPVVDDRVQFDSMLANWTKNNIIKTYTPITMFAHQSAGFSAVLNRTIDRDCNKNNIVNYYSIDGNILTSSKEDLKRYKDHEGVCDNH